MIDEITAYIVAILPSVITVISVLAMVIKLLKNYDKLKEEVINSNRMKKIEEQVKVVIQENCELKKQIKLMIEKIDKVKIKDKTDDVNK